MKLNPIRFAQWIVGGIGTIFLGVGLLLYSLYGDADSWPIIDAKVRGAHVTAGFKDGDQVYNTRVELEYDIGGKIYDDIKTVAADLLHRSSAEQLMQKYPKGRIIPIKVNPDKPTRYVMDDADTMLGPIFAAIGLALVLIAYFLGRFKNKVGNIPLNKGNWSVEVKKDIDLN